MTIQKKFFFVFFMLTVLLGFWYYFFVFTKINVPRNSEIQTRENELGKFTEDHFGFGVDMSSEEYSQMGAHCDDTKTPDKFNGQDILGKIVCNNGGSSFIRLWIGWQKSDYTKFEYERDMGNQLLKLASSGSLFGDFTCKEDTNFSWYAKMPAVIEDCLLVSSGKKYAFSVLFFHTNKTSNVSQAITVLSLDANMANQEVLIPQKLRSFVKRIRYT
ncbi:MAG: hypothetical protein WCG73_03480, partial [Candidatus Moraniibacteriota bacterium]